MSETWTRQAKVPACQVLYEPSQWPTGRERSTEGRQGLPKLPVLWVVPILEELSRVRI